MNQALLHFGARYLPLSRLSYGSVAVGLTNPAWCSVNNLWSSRLMLVLAFFLLATSFATTDLGVCPGECTDAKNIIPALSACAEFVNYRTCVTDAYLQEEMMANTLSSFRTNATWTTDCLNAFTAYQCARTYKQCTSDDHWLGLCLSTCQNYVSMRLKVLLF